MPRGITSAATSAPTGGVGATDFTTTATKKAPRRKASYIGKKATIGTDAKFIAQPAEALSDAHQGGEEELGVASQERQPKWDDGGDMK